MSEDITTTNRLRWLADQIDAGKTEHVGVHMGMQASEETIGAMRVRQLVYTVTVTMKPNLTELGVEPFTLIDLRTDQ